MPTLASQTSITAVRRARRRERRIATRAHLRPQFPYSSSTTANRKHNRHYRSRDRASYDVDDCFDICQDGGYHRNPDVHLGSGVRIDVNQFAVLEQDVSCPSIPNRFPENSFNFSHPSPCTSLIQESTCPAVEVPSPATPTPLGKHLLKRCRWPTSSKLCPPIAPSSPLLPSIPSTPYAEPKVKLLGSFPGFSSSSHPSSHTSGGTGYLDGIKIPSPLLYHKRSLELQGRSSDEDINAELAKTFSLTCGRDIPEPDFESYKPFDEIAGAGTPLTDQPGFIAARLPVMEPDMTKTRRSRSNPRPPWAEQSKQMSSSSTWPPILTNTTTMPPLGASQLRSHLDAIVTGPSCSFSHANNRQQKSLPFTDLVFPTLNVPDGCLKSLNKVTSTGLWELPANKPEFIDDDPVTVFKRWAAFEKAILHPKNVDAALSSADQGLHAVGSTPAEQGRSKDLHSATSMPSNIEMSACPTSTCMALVPARLYEQQYIGWPRRSTQEPDYSLGSYTILGSPLAVGPGLDNVPQMSTLVKELGFDKQHQARCPLAVDITSSFDEDFKVASEAASGDVSKESHSDESRSFMPSTETPAIEVDDEGYFTCQESGSEIDVEEATLSDDDWADWDWEHDLQDEMPIEGEGNNDDAHLDVFGVVWGF